MDGRFHAILIVIIISTITTVLMAIDAVKYSTRIVRTKYGPLRGIIARQEPIVVEAFLGVPYATPPLGSLRYMPPVTPSIWKSTKLADKLSNVCPQNLPVINQNRTEALKDYPESRLDYLETLLPLLTNQSEDCLYLNIYVPLVTVANNDNQSLPCLVYVHGESYEWNSGNVYDGTILAAYGRIIVVTVNFRLGILGFLKTGSKSSAQGNFGLMDLIASLHWLRENLFAFGGDPERVTLMGHDTGAAIANFIAVSPVTKELLHHVIMISGSSLSPWALQKDPLAIKRAVATLTNCTQNNNVLDEDLAPCLRSKPLADLLAIRLDRARFLPGFAPFVDGSVLPTTTTTVTAAASNRNATSTTTTTALISEMANFSDRNLLFGLTTLESYLDLSANDLTNGCNETKRDKILRTYVRNCFYFHLNEIFSTLRNEYTDWERPIQNPYNIRNSIMEILGDGHTVSPLIKIGFSHSLIGGRTFFFHFKHQSSQIKIPQRTGSVRGEDIHYLFGIRPLSKQNNTFENMSEPDLLVAKLFIYYVGNFARTGNPNDLKSSHTSRNSPPFWESYDSINQMYLELGNDTKIKSHYRGHKMSLWLNLIPQLHQNSDSGEFSMRHHHFLEEGPQFYDGFVRPQLIRTNYLNEFNATTNAPITTIVVKNSFTKPAAIKTTTECPPIQQYNAKIVNNQSTKVNESRRHAPKLTNENSATGASNSSYENYKMAFTITIVVGCTLLFINILIFVGIYRRQRSDKSHTIPSAAPETGTKTHTCCHQADLAAASAGAGAGATAVRINNQYEKSPKHQPHRTNDLNLNELKGSPPSPSFVRSASASGFRHIEQNIDQLLNNQIVTFSCDNSDSSVFVAVDNKSVQVNASSFDETTETAPLAPETGIAGDASLPITETGHHHHHQQQQQQHRPHQTFGILKNNTKKRVQIQEISV